jgi:hypothetical protein
MRKEDDILCIFLRMKEDLTKMEEYDEKEQILYFKGKEEYIPGILYKTIKGIQYILKNYDFGSLNVSAVGLNDTILSTLNILQLGNGFLPKYAL